MDNQVMLPQDVEKKGQEIYSRLKDSLEQENLGKFVTIDVISEVYFIGETLEEALLKAKEKYPNRVFHTVKIGSPGVFSQSSSFSNNGYNKWFS